jgi:hypothetical protein
MYAGRFYIVIISLVFGLLSHDWLKARQRVSRLVDKNF